MILLCLISHDDLFAKSSSSLPNEQLLYGYLVQLHIVMLSVRLFIFVPVALKLPLAFSPHSHFPQFGGLFPGRNGSRELDLLSDGERSRLCPCGQSGNLPVVSNLSCESLL